MTKILVVVLGFASVITGLGQDFRSQISVGTDWNFPVSNKEFAGNVSFRSLKIKYRDWINEKLTVGGDLGFAHYQDRLPPDVYGTAPTLIYAELFTHATSYTATLAGEYQFMPYAVVMPHAGFGLGVSHNQYFLFYNRFEDSEKSWGLILRPHVGATVRFGKEATWGINAGIQFDFATSKVPDYDYKNFSTVGFYLGVIKLRRA